MEEKDVWNKSGNYVVFDSITDQPILITPKNQEIGIHYPVFNNPLDARRFGELFSESSKIYVRQIYLGYLTRE